VSKTAVVTGATSGIGAAYAKRLAADGYDLILVGRRKEIIQKLADGLSSQNHVKVQVVIADLSSDDNLQDVIRAIKSSSNVEMLINNAGYAISKTFAEMNSSEYETMVKVHELAPMKLMSTVIPNMMSARKGTIINVSSIGAFFPVPRSSTYNSTKVFLKLFTEALHLELRDSGIKVQVLCPGFVDTDFYRFTTQEKKEQMSRGGQKISPEMVVNYSLKCLKKNQAICIPGASYRAICWIISVLPRNMVYRIAGSVFKDF
jgi:uncharacterized protein